MSGQEGSGWNQWGNPLLSTLLKVAGLGIAANRGAAGAPLAYLGDLLSNAREQGFERSAGSRYETLLRPRSESVTMPGPLVPGEEPGTVQPPARRTYERGPTQSEVWKSFAEMKDASPQTRQRLLEMILRSRFPTEATPTEAIERERRGGATEELLRTQGVPEDQRRAAREVISAGGAPTVQVPPRLEADERAFRGRVAKGEFGDPKTTEGAYNIELAARNAGLHGLADSYAKERGTRKEFLEEQRKSSVKERMVPAWRSQLEGLGTNVSPLSRSTIESAIIAAENDPSPANVKAVQTALANVRRVEAQSQQHTARLAAQEKRLQEIVKSRDVRVRVQRSRMLLDDLNKDLVAVKKQAANTFDPVEKAHLESQAQDLEYRHQQLRDYISSEALSGGDGEGESPLSPGGDTRLRHRFNPQSGQLEPVGR